jgi:hypothetical protein
MKLKAYISANGLPNTNYVLSFILNKLKTSGVNLDVYVIHDSMFNPTLFNDLYDLNLTFIQSDDNLYEYPALRKIWFDSKDEDFYALYLHTKGASKIKYDEIQNSIAWLEYMLFGVLDNADMCINHMNNGADIVGSMWYNHFKGNFFWCKSSYVKTLLDPYQFTVTNRFNAEYWISMPFDKHWFEISKKIYGLDLVYPLIKNLFYLPIESDFADFLKLKNKNYIPDLNQIKSTNNISFMIYKSFMAYDELYISKEEFDKFRDDLKAYLNYDAKIIIQ